MSDDAYAASRLFMFELVQRKKKWLPFAANVNALGILTEEEEKPSHRANYCFDLDFVIIFVEVRMAHAPLEKIQALDAIEKDIINCVHSAGK